MTALERPKLGFSFDPVDEDDAIADDAENTVRQKQSAVRETVALMSRANNAPKEPGTAAPITEAQQTASTAKPASLSKRKAAKAAPRSEPSEKVKPSWRQRPGRPRSHRQHPMTIKSTEAHLKFLYFLTDENGLRIEGIEDGLVLLAREVASNKTWRGRHVPREVLEAADELLKAYPTQI